jgi:hypothetical protein
MRLPQVENQRWLGWFKLVFKRAENQNVAGLASGQFRIITNADGGHKA